MNAISDLSFTKERPSFSNEEMKELAARLSLAFDRQYKK